MLKVLVGQKHRMWLDESENVDRWYENQTPYTAMDRRILITHWVGDAWETLCGPNYEHLSKRCWETTGCLITADGSDDDKISPEGLPMYKVPPPIDYIPATEALPTINQALGDEDEIDFNIHQEEDPEDFDAGADEPDNGGEEFEDHEDHRSDNAPYCGRKLKALYENGWHTGKSNITTNTYRSIIYNNLMTAPMTKLPKTKSIWWKYTFSNFISASSYHVSPQYLTRYSCTNVSFVFIYFH